MSGNASDASYLRTLLDRAIHLYEDGAYSRWQLPPGGRLMASLLWADAFLTVHNILLPISTKNILLIGANVLPPRWLCLPVAGEIVDFEAA